MNLSNLENLVKTKALKKEPFNLAEYEGFFEVDEVLLYDLIQVAQKMLTVLEGG